MHTDHRLLIMGCTYLSAFLFRWCLFLASPTSGILAQSSSDRSPSFLCRQNGDNYIWCDQAKWVWTWNKIKLSFHVQYMPRPHRYITLKTPSKLSIQFQGYDHFSDAQNNQIKKENWMLLQEIHKNNWYIWLMTSIIQCTEDKDSFHYSSYIYLTLCSDVSVLPWAVQHLCMLTIIQIRSPAENTSAILHST